MPLLKMLHYLILMVVWGCIIFVVTHTFRMYALFWMYIYFNSNMYFKQKEVKQ